MKALAFAAFAMWVIWKGSWIITRIFQTLGLL